VNVFPVEHVGGKTIPLATSNCTVHLIHAAEQSREWTYPCGKWFQPAVGRYLFWAEQGATISLQSVLSYAGESFTGSGLMLSKTMQPAGFLRTDNRTKVPPDATLRFVSLRPVGDERPFDRRLDHKRAHEPVRLPAGAAITGVFDRAGRALSLTRPIEVTAGTTAVVRPEGPARNVAHVLAVVSRSGLSPRTPCDITLAVRRDFPTPTVNLQSQERVIAAWYDVPAPAIAVLRMTCSNAQPWERTLHIRPGAIETLRATLPSRAAASP